MQITINRPGLWVMLLGWVLVSSQATGQPAFEEDWLVTRVEVPVVVSFDEGSQRLTLENGLIKRVFKVDPNAATIRYDDLTSERPLIRAVQPEARLQLDGTWYDVGGLNGQPNKAYLLDSWIEEMVADPKAFQFERYTISDIEPHLQWKRRRYASEAPWPPAGKTLTLHFLPPDSLSGLYEGLQILIHYDMYQGIPALAKRFTLVNGTDKTIALDAFVAEELAIIEVASSVEPRETWPQQPIHVQSDYAFHGMDPESSNRTTYWEADTTYLTQVSYLLQTPVLLKSKPPIGPGLQIKPGDSFASFRTYELLLGSDDRERRGLALRRFYRTVAPWVTEAPIFMHVREADSESIRLAVDQAAEVGFEMVIMTFGSGFDIESKDPEYIAQIKSEVEYAHSKGIELGGYSLLSSRRVSDEHDVINPETGKTGGAIFGNAPCLRSEWGEAYFKQLSFFITQTGLDALEHDGPYPGDLCASASHPYHRGLADSQWKQWKRSTDFYGWSLEKGVYLNVPDFYFLNGSTRVAMGYRETNWSLPREQQIIHARQNIFDGTWEKTPSMGWMFVPLVEYHGGGAAATLEPLSEHLDAYESHLANLFSAGVMAAYRGPRLYDTEATKQVVKKWVDFYKRYRDILNSDIIHWRRADGVNIDGFLHVNPALKHRGLAVFFNPSNQEITQEIKLPLYYTGLTSQARIRKQEGPYQQYTLDRTYNVSMQITVPANGMTWYVIEE